MKVLLFEMRKLWHQKKLLWLLLILLLCTCGNFIHHMSYQSTMTERAQKEIDPLIDEVNHKQDQLRTLREEGSLNDSQLKQLEYIKNMNTALTEWRADIYYENWHKIPDHEAEVLSSLQQFEQYGGEFSALEGIEREKAIHKNDWLRAHNLSYEDEAYPLSSHLNLKENTTILLSMFGILLLLLFFGNTITVEKEQNTWMTLITQPISKWKLIAAKYASLLMVVLAFLVMVVVLGLIIPLIFGDHTLNLQYPQIVSSGYNVTTITTFRYVARGIVLFICASAFVFSLVVLFSTWVKNSFTALLLIAFIMIPGYFITDMNTLLQSALNPFQYFRFTDILSALPHHTDWVYPISAFIWSIFIVSLAIFLPEKKATRIHERAFQKPFRRGKTQNQALTFWALVIFEWRKIRRKGLLKQVHIVFLLLIIFGYFVISQEANEKEFNYMKELERTAQTIENSTIPYFEQMYEEHMQEAGESVDQEGERQIGKTGQIKTTLDYLREKLALINVARESYEDGDWIPLYEYQLFENQFANKELETGVIHSGIQEQIGQFTIDVSLAEKYWLLDRNIQPVFSGEFVPTIFLNWSEEQPDETKSEWEEKNLKVDNSGLFTLYLYFDHYLYYGTLVLLFLLGSGFAVERGKNSTLNFLKTQPVSEKMIYLGKVFSTTSATLISWIGIVVSVVLVGTIFNRVGNWHYPIVTYDSARLVESSGYTGTTPAGWTYGFRLMPIGEYLLQSVILFLFVLLFLMVLSNVLSVFFKSQMSVYAVTIIIAVFGYVISTREALFEMVHLSPFTYLNTANIANGEMSVLMNNPAINVLTGSLVIVSSTLILVVFGYLYLRIKKKNKV